MYHRWCRINGDRRHRCFLKVVFSIQILKIFVFLFYFKHLKALIEVIKEVFSDSPYQALLAPM
jgi:hypothetical protein